MAIDINGDGLIQLGGTSTTQGRVRLNEDTDNGTNYVELTAPASVTANRTVTFPDSDMNFATGLNVAQGGTGATTLTANNVILGNGTSAVQLVAPGASGNLLTSNGTTWASTAPAAPSAPSTADVLNATAGASQGAVGTYILGYNTSGTTISPGGTLAGSSIQNAGLGESGGSAVIVKTGTLSGTWRCMGYSQPGNSGYVTVWLRTV